MRKGYTLVDVLVVVIILSVLATVAIPAYRNTVRRAELREARNLVELVRTGAKYYGNKYGIETIDPSKGQPAIFQRLKVEIPAHSVCIYQITKVGTIRRLEVRRRNDNALLYTYTLPDGPGNIQATSDARYLQGLPQ